jgi:hypothetical protein
LERARDRGLFVGTRRQERREVARDDNTDARAVAMPDVAS